VTLLVHNILAFFVRNFFALFGVGCVAFFFVGANILVDSFAIFLWCGVTTVFVRCFTSVFVFGLALGGEPGLAGSDVVELAPTAAREGLQSGRDDVQG